MAHFNELVGHPCIARMHVTLQQNSCCPQMADYVTFAVRDCLHCAKKRILLRKQARSLKLFPSFEALWSVAINILRLLTKSRTRLPVHHCDRGVAHWTGSIGTIKTYRLGVCRSIIWCTEFTSMYRQSHYYQITENTLHLNSSRVCVSFSRLILCLPIHTVHRPMGRENEKTGHWQPCCAAMLTIISGTGYCTIFHSHVSTAASYTVLQTLVLWSGTQSEDSGHKVAVHSVYCKTDYRYLATE